MNQKVLHKIFVWGFLFLYLLVALISFCHAVQFFGIGNVTWMSIVLAFSFELGLALSLASILLSDKNKSQTLPWILMITLTAVQVIGNVYSVFKYISLSDVEYYQYLAKPLLFFMEEVEENTIQVIVSWIMGAILPIVALMMTDMVASNIKNIATDDENPKEIEEEKISEVKEAPKEITKPSNNSDSIADYVDVLSKPEPEKPVKEEVKVEEKPKVEPLKKKESKIFNFFNKKKDDIVNNPKKDESDHLELRHPSQSYFKDPTVKR